MPDYGRKKSSLGERKRSKNSRTNLRRTESKRQTKKLKEKNTADDITTESGFHDGINAGQKLMRVGGCSSFRWVVSMAERRVTMVKQEEAVTSQLKVDRRH